MKTPRWFYPYKVAIRHHRNGLLDRLGLRVKAIRVAAALGLYEKNSCGDGRYYYVVGPFLDFQRFAVIREDLETKEDEWLRDWMTGAKIAVLWFAFWKVNCRNRSAATFAETIWFYGFQYHDRQQSARRS
jgi:hypothetical protein